VQAPQRLALSALVTLFVALGGMAAQKNRRRRSRR